MLNETINVHPDKFDADIELANILAASDQAQQAKQVYETALARNGQANIGLLKAYTAFLFKTKQLLRAEQLLIACTSTFGRAKRQASGSQSHLR